MSSFYSDDISAKIVFKGAKKSKWILFNQIIFIDRLIFDPISGDFISFLLNKMFYQNRNPKLEESISRTFSLKRNFQEYLLWIARNEPYRWWVTPVFRSERNHTTGGCLVEILACFITIEYTHCFYRTLGVEVGRIGGGFLIMSFTQIPTNLFVNCSCDYHTNWQIVEIFPSPSMYYTKKNLYFISSGSLVY